MPKLLNVLAQCCALITGYGLGVRLFVSEHGSIFVNILSAYSASEFEYVRAARFRCSSRPRGTRTVEIVSHQRRLMKLGLDHSRT